MACLWDVERSDAMCDSQQCLWCELCPWCPSLSSICGDWWNCTSKILWPLKTEWSPGGWRVLCFYLRFCRYGEGLSLPWSVHVVIFPFNIDTDGLIDPLLLGRQRVDFVRLAVVRVPWCCHICLGEVSGSAVRGVKEGLVVAHHRQSLLRRKKEKKKQVLRVMTKPVTPLVVSLWAGEHLRGPHSCPALSEIAICQDCGLNQILWGPSTRMQNQRVALSCCCVALGGSRVKLSLTSANSEVAAGCFIILITRYEQLHLQFHPVTCPPACTCWSKTNSRDMHRVTFLEWHLEVYTSSLKGSCVAFIFWGCERRRSSQYRSELWVLVAGWEMHYLTLFVYFVGNVGPGSYQTEHF